MAYIPPPSTLPPGSIVDCYLRDSGNEKQDRSIPSQLIEVQAYCRTHQLILRHIYKDTRSGKSIVGRKDFDRMVDDIQIAEANPKGILLWDYARFARSARDAVLHIALIEDQGVIVHSLTDEIPEGEYRDLIRLVKHMGNEAERRKNANAVKRELHQLVRLYKAMFGTPPRGITTEPLPPVLNERTGEMRQLHKWVPDPEWKSRIRKAFSMKAAGATLEQIHEATHIFNSLNSYKTFFENKIYIGILVFGDYVDENYCEPIVDRETWDLVQKILALHAQRQHTTAKNNLHPRRRSSTTYLLSGIASCARCESPLYGLSAKQRNGTYYLRYACTKAKRTRDCDLIPIPAKTLEKAVIEKLTVIFEHPSNLAAMMEEELHYHADLANIVQGKIDEINSRLKETRRAITNVTEAIASMGNKKSKSLLEKLATLEAEETQLESDLHLVKTENPDTPAPLTPSQVTFLSRRLVARLQHSDHAIVRNILLGIVHQVLVDRTPSHTFATIQIHTPREPKTPEEDPASHNSDPHGFDPGIITMPTSLRPMGAPIYRRSIQVEIPIGARRYVKSRSE